MGYSERKKLYEEIEKVREHPLITYVTSIRPGVSANIASDAIRHIEDQLLQLPQDTKKLDLIVGSHGGDGLAAWRIVSIIREFLGAKGNLTVLVPHHAFSAATLLALGADEIYMHPFACLGPIDPQITVTSKDGQQKFAYQDLIAFAEFLREEGKLTEQPQISELLKFLMQEIKPSVVGASKRSSSQSVVMAQKLLSTHMSSGSDAQKAQVIAESLNRSFFSHGHAVSRTEAKDLGLKIAAEKPELSQILWKVHLDLEQELKEREPFNPLSECLSQQGCEHLTQAPPHLPIPGNIPDPMKVQMINNYMQSAAVVQSPTLDFELINAMIESPRSGTRFLSRGRAMLMRLPNLDFTVSAPILSAKWEKFE